MKITEVNTPKAPKAVGPYVQANKVGKELTQKLEKQLKVELSKKQNKCLKILKQFQKKQGVL